MSADQEPPKLLPHHEQQELCTTRLPYRQGRKFTAVKVYTINNESKHLLIFGVPSLNLRQETKALFMQFGKLQLNITSYPSEQFTETYHAIYEGIESARIAKKMLDTKNYYGGVLHVCYAPELETIADVREKILQRKYQVMGRLKNLLKESSKENVENKVEECLDIATNNASDSFNSENNKMNMGSWNTIVFGKRKFKETKKFITKKPKITECFDKTENKNENVPATDVTNVNVSVTDTNPTIDIIDFTSPQIEVVSNINEALNYNKFGQEIIKQVPYKPVNRIKFNLNKKSY